MKTDEFIIQYGTSGAELICPKNCGFQEELVYPMTTFGEIKKIAEKHIKKEH